MPLCRSETQVSALELDRAIGLDAIRKQKRNGLGSITYGALPTRLEMEFSVPRRPHSESRETMDSTAAVLNRLRALVMSADDDVLRDIATYDRHGGGGVTIEEACELHFQGLKHLIDDCDLSIDWETHFWYPLEAVELRASVRKSGRAESFAVATAILLIDDLRGGVRAFYSDELRLFGRLRLLGSETLRAMPERFSQPIIEGLELLQSTAE